MTSDSNTAPSHPLVSIGLPVYNEAANLESAVNALLAQTYRNTELIISDNASSDDTESVGKHLAEFDERVRFVRQPENLGAIANFRYVLERANGELFMWAAADDRWDPSYVEKNVANLVQSPELVGSVSRVEWTRDGAVVGLAAGTGPLCGSPRRKVAKYLRHATDNSRFYGVFRREALVSAYPAEDFYGLDIATMLGTLLSGDHAEIAEVLMTRHRNDPMAYIAHVDAVNRGRWSRWFPMIPFTRYVIRELRLPLSPATATLIVVRNAYEHFRYVGQRRTLYGAASRFVIRQADTLRERTVGRGR